MAEKFSYTYNLKEGPPKLSEDQVPFYQQLIGYDCKSPEQREAAQKALDARDIKALQAALLSWGE